MKSRADLKREYKETAPPMGVFLVRNRQTNQFILGQSRNLNGSLNKIRFALELARPSDPLLRDPQLQEDFIKLGEAGFEFKILDTLKPKDEPGWDPMEDLKALEKLWKDELTGRGWKPYS